MAGETRDLKFKLSLEYNSKGLDAFRSDIDDLPSMIRGAAGGLDDLASSLDSIDAGGLADDVGLAADGLSDLQASSLDAAAGVDTLGGRLSGLRGGLEGLGKVSLGAVAGIGAGLTAAAAGLTAIGLGAAGEAIQGVKDLQAQLGLSEEQAKHLGEIGKEVFKDNWGESVGEAQAAVGQFARAFDFDVPAAQLKTITEQGFAVQQAFDFPVEEQARALSVLSANFGDVRADATIALDQITALMQDNDANADDLLETIGEYSPLMSQLGLDSTQFFGLLQSGLQAGARDTDFIADAMKEFGIRITDDSDSTREALANLGLDGLGDKVRAGVVTGADAFQMIQDKLNEIPPDMRAAEGAVALFGTKFEDLGPQVFEALSTDPLARFEGAAMDAGNVASSSLGAMWETIKRNAVTALGDAFTPLVERLQEAGPQILGAVLPALQEIGGKLEGALGQIDIDALVARLPEVLDTAGGLIDRLVERLGDIDFAAIADKVLSVGDTIGGVLSFLADNPAIAKVGLLVGGLATAFGSILAIVGPFIPVITTVVSALSGAAAAAGGLSVILGTVGAVLTGPVGLAIAGAIAAFALWQAKGDEIKEALSEVKDTVLGLFSGIDLSTVIDVLLFPVFGIPNLIMDHLGGFSMGDVVAGWFDGVELPDISGLLGDFSEGFSLEPDMTWLEKIQNGLANTGEMGQGFADSLQGVVDGWEPPDIGAKIAQSFEDGIESLAGMAFPELDLGGLDVSEQLDTLFAQMDLSGLTDPFTDAWADIQSGIDSAWAEFDATIQGAQDAIYSYLLDIWMQIPEDIRADLVLIADHILEQFEVYRQTIEDKLTEAQAIVFEKFEGARDTVDQKLDELVTIVSDAFVEVKEAILGPLHEAQAELLAIWSSVSTSASNVWGQVTTAVSDGVNRALAVLSNLRADVEARARAAWDGAVESARSALAPLVSVVTDAIDDALAFLSGVRSEIEARSRDAWEGVVTAADSALASLEAAVLDPIRQTLSRVAGLAGEAKTQALALGQAIVDGAKTAIIAGRDAVVASVLGISRAVLQAIKDFFSIKSPAGLTYDLFLYGVMGGAVLGIYDSEPLMVDAIRSVQAAVVSAAADTPVLFLVDPAAEAAALAPFIAEIDRTTAALRAASDAAAAFDDSRITEAVGRITAAFDAWFDSDAEGSLKRTLELLAGGGMPPIDEGGLLNSLGFDVSSFDELQARIDALSDEPEKQREMWQAVVSALTDDWKRFYDKQKASLDASKEALAEGADSTDIDNALAALDERNRSITEGLNLQGDGLDRMLDAYERITGEQDELTQAIERANREREQAIKLAQDEIKVRQRAAEDAEEGAHDQAMDLLDDEVRARERAHDKEMKALDEHRKWVEADIERRIGLEEEAHNQRLSAITAEVDAMDAVNKAEDARLTRAGLLLDTLEKGNVLTQEQADFLRAQGIDPDAIAKTNQGLADAKANIDKAKLSLDTLARSLETLTGFLDKLPDERGRVSIAGGRLAHESGRAVRDGKGAPQTISEAERAALQKGIDDGTLTGSDKRIAEVALAGGVVQAQRLREVLGTLIGPQEAAAEAAEKQLSAAEAILVVQESQLQAARDKLGVDEAALKVAQDEAKSKREGLSEQIRLEDLAFENFKTTQEARLNGLAEERAARDAAFKEWKQAISDAKDIEDDRHAARMKAIDEEYALELLRAGMSEVDVQKKLAEQRERAAAIATEAERRFNELMARAGGSPATPSPFAPPGGQPPPGIDPPINPPGDSLATFEDVFGDITAAGARTGQDLATALVDPAIDRMDDLHARAVDIAGLFAGDPGAAAFMGGGTAHIDNGIHFHGDVYIDRDVAEEIGLYDAARMGAP